MCPGNARRGISPRPAAAELRVAGSLFRFGLLPVVPAFRPDNGGHFCVQERGAGINPPWTSQVGFHLRRFTSDIAVRKNKAERLILRGGGGSDVSVAQTMDVTPLKKIRGGAEDEIDVAGDVAVLEIVAPAIGQDRILPAEKTAVPERHPVPVNADRQSLAFGTGAVFKSKVLGRKIVRIDGGGWRVKSPDRLAVRAGQPGKQIAGQHGLFRIVTD